MDRADPRFFAWSPDAGAKTWTIHGREEVLARGPGSVRLPSDGGSVMDSYRDGYPGKMAQRLKSFATYPVGDLRLEGEVRAHPNLKSLSLEMREGSRVYRFTLPGPAAEGKIEPWSVRVPAESKVYPSQPDSRVVTCAPIGGGVRAAGGSDP